MKFIANLSFIIFVFSFLFLPNVFADYTEKVKVIKFDKERHDLIVERDDGDRLLIQHNRQCGSMSTEFPVTLIWSGEKVTQLKVNFNEICKVYNTVSYAGEGELTKLTKSENFLVSDHLGEIIWNNNKYAIDYNEGCRYFWDFLGKRIYFSSINEKGGEIILPGNRGQCSFDITDHLGIVENTDPNTPEAMKGLDYQAQNNQAYFYWERQDTEENPLLYLISHSRYKIDTNDFNWREMPSLIRTRRNTFTVRRLQNGRTYYFYLAVVNSNNTAGPWTEAKITPVAPESFVNKPDIEEFEIEMEEKEDEFVLTWPEKEEIAKRYFVRFYINGKQEYFKILKTDKNEFSIPKKPEYANKRMRLTVRTIPKRRSNPRFYDGHFWVYREKE